MQMHLDKAIVKSIDDVVAQAGESEALAKAIINWISAVHAGDSKLDDRDDVNRRIELLLQAVKDDN